jgi:hypothetical protein
MLTTQENNYRTKNLICITDGSPGVTLGIAYLIDRLALPDFAITIWILAPEQHLEFVKSFLIHLIPSRLLQFRRAEMRGSDLYSFQLEFASLATEIPEHESVMCLDYDHVIFRSDILAIAPPNNGLLVSSEVTNSNFCRDYGFDQDITSFFNISLIVAQASILGQLREIWTQIYEQLYSITDQRHRVEYAFTLAVSRTKIAVYPCQPTLQSNWKIRAENPAMFHYGGETSSTKGMKALLSKLAQSAPLNQNLLIQVHHELSAYLRMISSGLVK